MKTPASLHAPVPYDPTFEDVAEDDAEVAAALAEELLKIARTVHRDTGHAERAVHAKAHGVLRGRLTVRAGLPPPLAQGLFATPANHPVMLRLSTSPGDVLPDSVSTPRGIAIKVYDVPGERLEPGDGQTTQDFLMVDGPAFVAPDARTFLKSLRLLARTTNRAEGLKKVVSAALRGAEHIAEAVGHPSPTLKALGGHPITHILGETYYTQAPLLYGRYMAKLSLAPESGALRALQGAALPLHGDADGLRRAVRDHFRTEGAEWTLRAQLCMDPQTMPIEDASVVWDEADSPYVPVASIVCPPQQTWDDAIAHEQGDRLFFSPWCGIVEHRPLGSVMRARRVAYRASAEFRREHQGCPVMPRTAHTTIAEEGREPPF